MINRTDLSDPTDQAVKIENRKSKIENREMLAAVLHGREDVRIERVSIPDVGYGEVRIKIAAALTCGTDVKVYRRGYHAHMLRPPVRFGHELAGVIEAIGEGV